MNQLFTLENKNAQEQLEYPLLIEQLPYIRVSSVSLMEECPKSWAAKFLLGQGDSEKKTELGKPTAKPSAGEIGTAVHVMVEEVLIDVKDLQEKGQPPDMFNYLNKHIPNHPALDWVPKVEKPNVVDYVATRLIFEGETIVGIELGGKMSWKDGEPPLSYHIDLVLSEGNHTIIIVDHKTNREKEGAERWSKKPQQMLYAFVIRRLFPNYLRYKWRIGYLNHSENVEWFVGPENDEEIIARLDRAWTEVKSVVRSSPYDIGPFRENANKYCNYCPVKDMCSIFKEHTIDFEMAKTRLLNPQMSLADRYEKLKLVAKLAEEEAEACKQAMINQLLSGQTVQNQTGTTYILDKGSRRRADFMPMFMKITRLIEDNNDEELWYDLLQHADELFTLKITGLDSLMRRHPHLKPYLKEFVRSVESEEHSLKIDKQKKDNTR